jgi:two-component system chemotaxis response regulator CheB
MADNKIGLVPFTCPRCKVVLQQVNNQLYQCPVGHVYSLQELIDSQYRTIESLLWTVDRIMEERAQAILLKSEQEPTLSSLFKKQAAASQKVADMIRTILQRYK